MAPDQAYSRYPKPLPADPETEAYIIRFLVSEDYRDTLMQLLAGLSYEVLEIPTQVVRRSADETGQKVDVISTSVFLWNSSFDCK